MQRLQLLLLLLLLLLPLLLGWWWWWWPCLCFVMTYILGLVVCWVSPQSMVSWALFTLLSSSGPEIPPHASVVTSFISSVWIGSIVCESISHFCLRCLLKDYSLT